MYGDIAKGAPTLYPKYQNYAKLMFRVLNQTTLPETSKFIVRDPFKNLVKKTFQCL